MEYQWNQCTYIYILNINEISMKSMYIYKIYYIYFKLIYITCILNQYQIYIQHESNIYLYIYIYQVFTKCS